MEEIGYTMLSRREALLLSTVALPVVGTGLLLSTSAVGPEKKPAPLPQPLTEPPQDYVFKRPPNGAGGFITGWDVDRHTGEMQCGTDVFNGGFRMPNEDVWTMMFRPDSLARELFDPLPKRQRGVGKGIYGFAYAPGTPGVGYGAWRGDLYRFENRQPTLTAFTDQRMRSNAGAARRFHPVIAVHPENDRIVAVGCNGGAVAVSRDGFSSGDFAWLDLPGAEDERPRHGGKSLVAWRGDELFVHVFGHGLFHYPEGPSGPRVDMGGPPRSTGLKILPSGDLWMVHYRFGAAHQETPEQTAWRGIWRLRDGRWTQFMKGEWVDQIAVDPFDEQRMIAVDENSRRWLASTTGPENLAPIGNEWRGEGETEWFSNRKKALYPAKVDFHPTIRNRIVIAEGVGICWADFPTDGKLVVHDFSNGIHELVATCGLSRPEQSTMIIGTMDKGAWVVDQAGDLIGTWSYADKKNEPNDSAVTHLRSADYAADDPDFVAGLFHQSNGVPGFSEDWAKTWKALPRKPDGKAWLPGGCIAVANRNDILLMEGNNGGLWNIDVDAGTVDPVGFGGVDQLTRQVNAYYVHRKNIAACKERPGVFAMVVNAVPESGERAGLWIRTPDKVWRQTVKGYLTGAGHAQYWQARIEPVPGHPGEWLYARAEGKGKDRLLWIRDDGTETELLPPSGLSSFAFGKGIGDRPAIFFHGYYRKTRGLYVTYDWFATEPRLISQFPGNSIDAVSTALGLVGDMAAAGRCAIGFGGNNWVFAEPA